MFPFILLAFSNQQDNYLEYLKKETSELRKILLGLQDKLEFQIISNATTGELFDAMTAYHDQVTVFHYGGHADSLALELENQPQGIEQFIQLLKGMSNLQVIFLNGCSTYGMVSKIQEGIGRDVAIIATASKIDDQRAFNFSKAFYTAFTQDNQTLEGAFEMAKSILSETDIQETTFRQSVPRRTADEVALPMPWGVYGNLDFTKKIQLLKRGTESKQVLKALPNSLEEFKAKIIKHLATGEIDEAMELAEQKIGLDNNTFVQLSGQWSRLKKQIQLGTMLEDSKEAILRENQIRNSISTWVKDLDEDDWNP